MDFSENVTVLKDGDRTLWIVGTAHVSEESVREVHEVIEEVRPDTVCVELCATRYAALRDPHRWKKLDVFTVIREGKTLMLLANLAISAYQRKLGQELGVEPGAELLAAAEKAEELGARLELVDRDIRTTLRRTWANVSFWRKMSLLGAITAGLVSREKVDEVDIEALKKRAQLDEMMAEFARVLPEVKEPLIDERDQYLMSKIQEAPGRKIVAVVGAGHVNGMTGWFGKEVDRDRLEEMPERSRIWSVLKWLIPGLILGAFAFGYARSGGQTLQQMLFAWVLPNSVMAALLTAAAGGKLVSIVTAFLASPITSLNPLINAGMVTGLVEAWARRPTVEDCERIPADVRSLKGIYKNAFTRVLLVAVAATLGSALGSWIGLTWVISLV